MSFNNPRPEDIDALTGGTGVVPVVGQLVRITISKGVGGQITQEMVDQAQQIKEQLARGEY